MARYLESGCCERTRAILLAEGDFQLSPRIADIRTCRDGGEEKDFWLYAESD